MAVVSKLKDIRKENHCSQQRMADDLGICVKTISKIECNKSTPSLEIAFMIAEYFHTDIQNIFHLEAPAGLWNT